MPVLVGMIAVLFQFGILFIAYLSLVHEMRDIGRYAAVHPDTVDGTTCSSVDSNGNASLWMLMCSDAPSVVDPSKITLTVVSGGDGQTRSCASLSSGHCATRPPGVELRMELRYDASSILFLPAHFRLGPWLNVAVPTSLPPYDYSIMVEQH